MFRLFIILAATSLLQGCFFFFIPGSVVGSVSDSLTGAEGQNCVPATASVGDRIHLPSGLTGTIKSLSGTSVRCVEPARPIRALITVEE